MLFARLLGIIFVGSAVAKLLKPGPAMLVLLDDFRLGSSVARAVLAGVIACEFIGGAWVRLMPSIAGVRVCLIVLAVLTTIPVWQLTRGSVNGCGCGVLWSTGTPRTQNAVAIARNLVLIFLGLLTIRSYGRRFS